jgi:hypothetical protein
MITFLWRDVGNNRSVFRDKDKIGTIKRVEGGWSYYPLFARKGQEVFKSISDCEESVK